MADEILKTLTRTSSIMRVNREIQIQERGEILGTMPTPTDAWAPAAAGWAGARVTFGTVTGFQWNDERAPSMGLDVAVRIQVEFLEKHYDRWARLRKLFDASMEVAVCVELSGDDRIPGWMPADLLVRLGRMDVGVGIDLYSR